MSGVLVLGAGRVGATVARDLSADPDLTVRVADVDVEALETCRGLGIEARRADLSDPATVVALCREADVAVGAVPGFLGRSVLRAALEAGTPVADVSFSPEDVLDLDGLARENGVPALVDFGVAPGLSNLLAGHATRELGPVERIEILVGGLPVRRSWPFEYISVFSPTDVIEEYLRPCRVKENGAIRTRPALSNVRLVEIPEVGTLEAFDTDGLRTLLHTLEVPDLSEQTLRYPGHADRMRMLRDTGFLDETPVTLREGAVRPRELAEALLFRAWRPREEDREFTVLRVRADGHRKGAPIRVTWDLLDRTDPVTGVTSMARTTGFPCAEAARILLDGAWTEPGVHPPEMLGGRRDLTARVLGALDRRGVRVRCTEEDRA